MQQRPRLACLVLTVLAAACGDDDGATPPVGDGGTPIGDGGVTPDGGGGYTEPLCDDTADLSDLAAAYDPSRLRETVEAIAMRRYPIGVEFIRAQNDEQLETWFRDTSSFDAVYGDFETAVHEGAHIWDFGHSSFVEQTYRLREDLLIRAQIFDNFARSEILALHEDPSDDFYASVYLEGFSGSQGFNNLLDEYNAYTHSLASRYCTRDSLSPGFRTSARDGILTFMYYVELYLKVARADHPDDYNEIVGDPGHLELILTVWDRAEFWLAITSDEASLGLNDETIAARVYDPENVAEIETLRDL